MAESLVQVTEGSGKKLHTNSRTIGANTVEDEYVLHGEPFLASYALPSGTGGLSIATLNDHTFAINAGASLLVYVRRIQIYQNVAATTAAKAEFGLFRTTTAAPTGGTVNTPVKMDNTDAAAGFTMMTLPTVKATEASRMWTGVYNMTQTVPVAGGSALMFDINFEWLREKALIIPAGTTNGLAFKNLTAIAAATVSFDIWVTEQNF